MDIIVNGSAQKSFKPERIVINLSFSNNEKTYEKCLTNGAKMVNDFIEIVLKELNIEKEELKTERFFINERTRYNQEKQKRIFDGYDFNQNSKLIIDYDMKKFSKFMDIVSKLTLPPSYRTSFDLKQEDERRTEVIAMAIELAKNKANAIAKACKKEIVDLVKVDFKPFDQTLSSSSINSNDMCYSSPYMMNEERCVKMSSAEMIEKNFTPEDIVLSETLYCLFIAK